MLNLFCRVHVYILLALLVSGMSSYSQFYQGSNVEFGKNRVQYREFDWLYFPGDHFEVYYYIGGDKFAEYVLRSAEKQLPEMEKFFDFSLDDKVQVLAYLKQSEFRQSNIGITTDEQTNLGGTARILGNKMFVYYEGDHRALDLQIRQNLARVIFHQMLYGGDWKDVLKSNTLLSVPRWYEDGIVRFASLGASEDADVFMRDQIMNGAFKSLNRLSGHHAALAGQAFWSYIREVYGEAVIANILYMARISRNVESGFTFVLGADLETLTNDFLKFYKGKYSAARPEQIPGRPIMPDLTTRSERWKWNKASKKMGDLKVKARKNYDHYQFKLSPDGSQLAYVTNEWGQYKVWLYDIQKGKKQLLLKRDSKIERLVDKSFPVIAWHPSGQVLAYVFEKRGRLFLGTYNIEEKKHTVKELFRLEKVVDMQYAQDGKKIIFSGVNRGQTDLYLYQVIGNNFEQLTNDVYDDLHPKFIENNQKIIFSSNRPDDTLRLQVPVERMSPTTDIFIFDLNLRDSPLEQVTFTKAVNEFHPSGYSPKHYTFLSNQDGVYNRYLATIDSAIASIDTTIHYRYFTSFTLLSAYARSPLDYQFNEKQGNYVLVNEYFSRPVIYIGNRSDDRASSGFDLPKSDSTAQRILQYAFPMRVARDTAQIRQVNPLNYVFEDERKDYAYEKETIKIQESKEPESAVDSASKPFVLPKSRNYRLNFATDFVVTQFNNNFGNNFYLPFSQPSSINPGLSALNQVGMSDLMEDYKLVGGFRISGNLQTNTYAISYENLKRRWDRRIMLQRQGELLANQTFPARVHIHSMVYTMKYPFNEFSSIRISLIGRNDRTVTLALDPGSLQQPNVQSNLVGLKGEYVYDNTISRGLNLMQGTRLKFWLERYQRPDNWNAPNEFNVVGGDVRHYIRIHRTLIAAFRGAGATTFGAQRLVHYLGGVDNWMFFQRIDNSTQIAQDQNYRFQSFAGPLRGFWVNARNGNSFALINSELRWPIFKYFLTRPIKSEFVENFQMVGFLDVGSAWTGRNPYDQANRFNQTIDGNRFVTVTVDNNREPIIYGYGFGLRSKLLGYFVRADWAWGVDDQIRLPRVFYLSLNLDF
jgi:hypothetical protein